ncbi:MAG: hypothetical protein U0M72_02660 [Eggerthellaceae bacterium]
MAVGRERYSGQMTVEFVIAFPVALVVALVSVNAVLFFSDCASFDRLFRSAVCTYAASPAYEQDVSESCALVKSSIEDDFSRENLQFEVTSTGASGGLVTFNGALTFQPTLFGMGPLSGAFGVGFPSLSHQEQITVDVYKSGVLI